MPVILPNLVEPAIRHLQELLSRLEEERSALEAKINEVTSTLQSFALYRQHSSLAPNGERHRKGENARTIAALFDAEPGAAWTKQEIADRAGLPFSSVQAILGKGEGDYQQGTDGLWKKKKTGGQ